jgi:uncharacterized protein (DUF2062 family)
MLVTPDGAPAGSKRGPGLSASLWRRLEGLPAGRGSHRRTAAAVALGVFLSFSPFLGLQIVLGLSAASLLRLSRIAVFAGLCTNLPWIMIPWYALTTATAARLLGTPIGADFGVRLGQLLELPVYRSSFWERAGELTGNLLWPYLVGSTGGALLLGVAAYGLLLQMPARPHHFTNEQP